MRGERVPQRPDAASLHEAALSYLARYAGTQATLTRVLDRAVIRWAQATAPEAEEVRALRETVRAVVARLAEAGAVDDAAFANGRARRLLRSGRSRRAVAAHLAARGVAAELADGAVPADERVELAAALTLARRRRIGPFRAAALADPLARRRELAAFARAGFPAGIARKALGLPRAEAEALLAAQRE